MEYAIPGFIGKFCTPNALMTLAEYLKDYATPETRQAGDALIREELAKMPEGGLKQLLLERLQDLVENDTRDRLF